MYQSFGLFISGAWRSSSGGDPLEAIRPAAREAHAWAR
jgi:hypothetical protein